MNMHHYSTSDNFLRNVLFAAFSLICILWYPPLLSNSADTDEKISHAPSCTNNQKDVISCDTYDVLNEISFVAFESEDQNEKEDFYPDLFTDGSTRPFRRKKEAFLIHTIASPMPGYLAPPPKTC